MKLAIISRRDSPNTLDLIKAAEDRGVECTVFPLKELGQWQDLEARKKVLKSIATHYHRRQGK